MKPFLASLIAGLMIAAAGEAAAVTSTAPGLTTAQANVCAKSQVNRGLERACDVVTELRDGMPPPMHDGPLGGPRGDNGFGNNDGFDDGSPNGKFEDQKLDR
jgi:hypothetical protein